MKKPARIYHVLVIAMIFFGFGYGVVRAALDNVFDSLYGPNSKLARLQKLSEVSKSSDSDGTTCVTSFSREK